MGRWRASWRGSSRRSASPTFASATTAWSTRASRERSPARPRRPSSVSSPTWTRRPPSRARTCGLSCTATTAEATSSSPAIRPGSSRRRSSLAHVGDDVITTDGTTLLGSDDKAGVAAIMTLVDTLMQNPKLLQGTIAVAFTADEEVGIGIDRFDVEAFGAAYAYTVDGEALGEINHETWNARLATITFNGVSAHPGSAKGDDGERRRTRSAISSRASRSTSAPRRPAGATGSFTRTPARSDVADLDRQDDPAGFRRRRPDRTRRQGAARPRPGGRERRARPRRARDGRRRRSVPEHARGVETPPAARSRTRSRPPVARALTPTTRPIRGGTDGSKLTFRGLPCPNIFTGGHNFHSTLEFNSRRGLEKTTETLVHLVQVFAERPAAISE